MFANYKKAFERLSGQVPVIAERYEIPKTFVWFGALCSYIRYGVTPNEYLGWQFYAKSHLEKNTFYSARRYKKYEKMLNDPKFYDVFWKKEIFNKTFSDFISRDWLFVPESSDNEIYSFINSHTKVIVKPTALSAGRGIHVYNNETIEDLRLGGGVLLEECIQQSEELYLLNPTSVNTIRVYTMIDRNGDPHVLSASIRVGGVGSTTDNFHSGGVGYPIDVEHGVVCGAGADMLGRRFFYHPGSNVKLIGFEVPRWKELLEYVFKACKVIPTARMIAWDVAITETGFDMVEGNFNGDPGFMQTPLIKGTWFEIKKLI